MASGLFGGLGNLLFGNRDERILRGGIQDIRQGGIQTPGLSVNNMGRLKRGKELQGYMGTLASSVPKDEAGYDSLISDVKGGFGTDKLAEYLRNAGMGALSDLKAQHQKRRVLGSSFADQNAQSVRGEYDQLIGMAMEQGEKDKINALQSLMTDRTNTRLATIGTALKQIQFEGDLASQVQGRAMEAITGMQTAMSQLISAKSIGAGAFVASLAGTIAGAAFGGPAGAAAGAAGAAGPAAGSTIPAFGGVGATQVGKLPWLNN